MKRQYMAIPFAPARLVLVEQCNGIIESYQAQGLRLTLRQLYYQLVTRNIVPNREQSYAKVGQAVSDARVAGLLDWDAIEDRVRVPRVPNEFRDIQDLVDVAVRSYRLPRWADQPEYVELWVEKDALSGVLAPIATQYHVTLMVNRGYSSQSAMFEAANRFKRHADKTERHLLYLGDHDPSGEDMVRDIADRLAMFRASVTVEKLALTMAQVEEYNPPPNPAKLTDSRAASYVAQHGAYSWEVDALPPEVLSRLVHKSITGHLDLDRMEAVKEREQRDITLLKASIPEARP